MNRQNLFSDEWDGEDEEGGTRHRIFWRPDDARMGATLYELAPNGPDMRLHMHFGAEEMFFVLSGRPVFRNQHGAEELAAGDFVFCPEGRAPAYTRSAIRRRNRLRSSRSAPEASRMSSPTPKTGMRGWRPGIPTPRNSREAATRASSLASRFRPSRSPAFLGPCTTKRSLRRPLHYPLRPSRRY